MRAFRECEETAEVMVPAVEKAVVLELALWLYRPGAECSPSDAR